MTKKVRQDTGKLWLLEVEIVLQKPAHYIGSDASVQDLYKLVFGHKI